MSCPVVFLVCPAVITDSMTKDMGTSSKVQSVLLYILLWSEAGGRDLNVTGQRVFPDKMVTV